MSTAANWPDAETLIPEVLAKFPQTREVLDRYGLRGCGGPLGPEEPLGFFARAHEVPLEKLLAEIRECLTIPPAPPRPTGGLNVLDNAWPQPSDTIYRPFFKAGIVIVLTLGAVWGAWLLLRIAITGRFSAASLHDINAHGHAQIFGWVGLFVMGFAYQAFPRFKHATLAWPNLAFGTLWMMIAGLVVRSVAQPAAVFFPWAAWPAIGASVLEILAIGCFVAIILKTWQQSREPLAFYDGYILCALFWFFVQAVCESIYLAATLASAGKELITLVGTWQPALRDLQIHGFALLMILGVSQRIFHHFYGLPRPNPTLSRVILVILNLAIVGEVAGSILMQTAGPAWSKVWYGSVLALVVSTIVLVSNWHIFSRTAEPDRSLKFLRAAYLWLFLSMAMLVAVPLYQFQILPALAPASGAAQIGFSHAYHGAIRHAITAGFISLMIMGVSSKVVPTLNGVASQALTPLWGPFILVNLGCSLRVLGQTATDFNSSAFTIAGVSGLLEVAGLALWGGHLWQVMAGRARRITPLNGRGQTARLGAEEAIGPQHIVGTVLDLHPQLLDVFVRFGFTTLTNPQFRQTIARVVTIQKACQRMGIETAVFLDALNRERMKEKPLLKISTEEPR